MREPGGVTLVPGSRLGPYEVVGPLGAGGMGEVHRARDPRLGRDVAIKALPAGFSRDPERLARFEREARLLASLSHPNIAGIHGLEEVGGHRYLVLEFVEGETLAARLARGPLPVREALEVCLQVAAGVEAAHESGVVHRDLKPGNVMLTTRDGVKVLDFGLAKGGVASAPGSDPNLSASPTMTYAATGAGVILGTAAYMSPEQARGKGVDRRTDIWSFGCVLYECLAGRPLYAGETVSDLIARILEREPDWSALPPDMPPRVRALLARCLRKDPRERLRDIGDARLELAEVLAAPAEPPAPGAAAASAGRGPGALAIAGWAVAVAALAAAGWLALRPVPRGAAPVTLRLSALAPDGVEIVNEVPDLVISPDGRSLAFTGQDTTGLRRIWLRPLATNVARPIPGTEGALIPFWSPDGRHLGFFADGVLKRIALDGGSPQTVCPAPNPRGAAWGPGDVILFAPAASGPLLRVPASGGDPAPATTLDSTRNEGGHRFPQFLPGGRHFLYVAVPGRDGSLDTRVGTLGDVRPGPVVLTAHSTGAYASPGYLVFQQRGSVMAQRFDPRSRRLSGTPRPIREIPDTRGSYSGSPMVSVSDDGALVFREPRSTHTRLDLVDLATGRASRTLDLPEAQYFAPRFSPDGTRLVANMVRPGTTDAPLWMVDVVRGTTSRFAFGRPFYSDGIWTRDGRWVIYGADVEGPRQLFRRPADGSGSEEQLGHVPNLFNDPHTTSADDSQVVFRSLSGETGEDLLVLEIGSGRVAPLIRTRSNETDAEISPDGRWIAYRSDESGRFELYVQPYPALDRKSRVSSRGAHPSAPTPAGWTRWSPDGRSLFFLGGDGQTLMRAEVESTDPFRTAEPRPVLRLPVGFADAEMTPDCRQLLVCVPEGLQGRAVVNIVMGWERELEPAR